ncbi:MAG: hypothetical protein ACHREM_04725 [Polyangiales bacterium]
MSARKHWLSILRATAQPDGITFTEWECERVAHQLVAFGLCTSEMIPLTWRLQRRSNGDGMIDHRNRFFVTELGVEIANWHLEHGEDRAEATEAA